MEEVRIDEDEEEFRSCCEDEDELNEMIELVEKCSECEDDDYESEDEDEDEELDEYSVKMYFKGVSITQPGDSGTGFSGIGVIMNRSASFGANIQVQKKLEFYVEESVADYLALMDGLLEAIQNKVKHVFAYTDSETLYNQVINNTHFESESTLLTALKERVLEQANNFETFILKLVPHLDLERALKLAQVAIGVVSVPSSEGNSVNNCSICCENKLSSMTIKLKCSHKFCTHCIKTYIESEIQGFIKCPESKCKYCISLSECEVFLPINSYNAFEKAFKEGDILSSGKIYCPYTNCGVILDTYECISSASQTGNNCIECPVCERFICVECIVPWHCSMSCEEYRNFPSVNENGKWRRCEQCRRMIELTYGCYHMTCWCGHEFCYSCGAEYRGNQQTCECAFWDENYVENTVNNNNIINNNNNNHTQQFEQWAWDSFESIPMMSMDAYSDQERSQLALIQRFLVGGFSHTDHHNNTSPSPPQDSYVDAMKDLHQLPWLERFVSVISDNYYDEYNTTQ